MLAEFTQWLIGLIKSAFTALWSFVVDAVIALVDLFVGAVVGLLAMIPVPEFLALGLQAVYGQLDGGILWVLTASGVPAALGILGTGYAFRLARKVATLFQW
jgi:hypothetical protein